MTNPLHTTRDLSKRFRKSEQWVRDLWRTGQIEAIAVQAIPSKPNDDGTPGKPRITLRFTEPMVEEFIRRNTRKGRSGAAG